MFGIVKLAGNAIKSKFICNGWGIQFDREGSLSFADDFAKNAVILGVGNTSLSHTDNQKNKFLVSVENQLMVLMVALVQQKKKI